MNDRDRIIDAFRNCITEPKCKDCPWDECAMLNNRCVEIPIDLALAVMRELVAQEPIRPGVGKLEDEDGVTSYSIQCPIDGAVMDLGDRYCRKCGRPVKW